MPGGSKKGYLRKEATSGMTGIEHQHSRWFVVQGGLLLVSQFTLAADTRKGRRPGFSGAAPPEREAMASGPPPYRLPVVGQLVTGLGEVNDSGVRARGLTLAVQPSAQAIAPTAGRVAFAGPYRDYGQILIIDHGGGWTTLITGLHRLSVRVGDDVRQGDPVGVTDNRRSDIIVELRRNGRPVDIVPLIGPV